MHTWYIALLIVNVLVALALVVLILIHPPKGEGMGGIGGAATLFTGKRTAETGLDRITNITALIFILLCAVLGFGIIRP